MILTRVIAGAILVVAVNLTGLQAQSLRDAPPPAEFPATSYKGKQYVDSRGCVYVRAGIDGTVTWVPRVTRQRKLVCGYQPTGGPTNATGAPTRKQAKPPVLLTVEPAPKPALVPKPIPETARANPAASGQPKPAQPAAKPKTVAAAHPPAGTGRQRVQTARDLPPDTRVVRRHVYDNRQNTTNVRIPKGYRAVWDDDRLNPNRTEHTLRPAAVRSTAKTPRGYQQAWDDGRLSRTRGVRTARGDLQTDQIWSRTLPRTLAPVPTQGRIVTIKRAPPESGRSLFGARLPAQPRVGETQTIVQVSTRSAPRAPSNSRRANNTAHGSARQYIRVATYASETDARQTARAFTQRGLPMRLGTVQRSGVAHNVVLAGPFSSIKEAKAALSMVQGAGFKKARISK